MSAAQYAVPALILAALALCLKNRADIYPVFCSGVSEGLKTAVKILPPMVAVMSAAAMLREAGLLEALCALLCRYLPINIDRDILTLALLRPVSGSGSVGLLADILNTAGPDSFAGRVCSVIAASSETTLYVLMVYFSATRVKYTKRVLIAALLGDFVCVLTAFTAGRIFF